MKRALTVMLITILMISSRAALAETEEPSLGLPSVSAYALYECNTGTCLAQKGADAAFPVAGLSKLPAIVTLSQAFDDGAINGSSEIRISSRAASIPGPTAFLSENESIQAETLLKAAVMISAGDAITALYENAYGSESVFLENIGVTVREAGAVAVLSDALGTGATLSPNTLFSLGKAASESPAFMRYACLFLDGINHTDGRVTELVSGNRMVRFYAGCDGILTGSSQQDGYSGVFHAKRNNMGLICVVIAAKNSNDRSTAAEILFNYGFSNFTTRILAKENGVIVPALPVRGGSEKTVNLISPETIAALLPKTASKLTEVREVPEFLTAPVDTSSPVGALRYLDENNEEVAVVLLYSDRALERFSIVDILRKIFKDFAR